MEDERDQEKRRALLRTRPLILQSPRRFCNSPDSSEFPDF